MATAMSQDRAREFRNTVLDDARTLCAVLDAPPAGPGRQADIQRICSIVKTLRDAPPTSTRC